MRIANVVRAIHKEPYVDDGRMDMKLDELEAMAAAGDTDAERYLRLLMDGQEPTEQYFEGAHPSE